MASATFTLLAINPRKTTGARAALIRRAASQRRFRSRSLIGEAAHANRFALRFSDHDIHGKADERRARPRRFRCAKCGREHFGGGPVNLPPRRIW